MAADDTIAALRAELERQAEVQADRHQKLLDRLAEQQGDKPLTAQDARRTMSDGYAQSAAERAAAKDGDAQ